MEFLHTGGRQPPYEWISLICRLRIYGCTRAEFEAMAPIDVMQDLMMLGTERTVRRVKGGGGSATGGGGRSIVQRGMNALRSMTGRG